MGERIIIVRVAALGDIVSTSVLLARIRAERPNARVTWLCGASAAPLVAMFDGVHEIITVDERRLFNSGLVPRAREMLRVWRILALRRFDLALIPHRDTRYRWLLASARVRRTRGLTTRLGDRQPPLRVRFWGDEYARLLDDGAERGPRCRKYQVADLRGRLPSSGPLATCDRAGAPLVCLVPGGARNVLRDDPHRRWPVRHYVTTARALRHAGCEVMLLGGADDAWVRDQFAGLDVEDRIGRTSLAESLALLESCNLVITHDTGPLHLARLVRARILALFGPTVPLETVGEDPSITALWGGEQLTCRPCYDGTSYAPCSTFECMAELGPDVVVRTALSILRSLEGSRPAARDLDQPEIARS